MSLTNKRRAFVDEYLKDCNATQAAIRAGYSENGARVTGCRLLANTNISELIKQRVSDRAMSSDEVIQRLSDMARGDMGDFLDIESMSYSLNLEKAKDKGLLHLIHKVRDRTVMTSNKSGEETETHTLEIELYDAHAALVDLGRYHKLFTDNVDVKSGGQPIKQDDEKTNRAILTLADAIRESISGAGDKQDRPLDASEQASVVSIPE